MPGVPFAEAKESVAKILPFVALPLLFFLTADCTAEASEIAIL